MFSSKYSVLHVHTININPYIYNLVITFFVLENFATICKLVSDYGDIFRVWIGPDLNIFLSNPKDVEVSKGDFLRFVYLI